MKAILIGVGADSNNSKILSPVFPKEDNEFVFLPIGDNTDGVVIKENTKIFGKKIINFLGREYIGEHLHIDPYFDEENKMYTYGDRTHNEKMKPIPTKQNLLELKPGNYLFFCNRMYEMDREDYRIPKYNEIKKKQGGKLKHLYLFGYFKIKRIDTINSETPSDERERIAGLHSKNAHIIRKDHDCSNGYLPKNHPKRKLILILGDENESILLKKAIKLTTCRDGRHYLEQRWFPYFESDNFGSSIGLCKWINNSEKFLNELSNEIF